MNIMTIRKKFPKEASALTILFSSLALVPLAQAQTFTPSSFSLEDDSGNRALDPNNVETFDGVAGTPAAASAAEPFGTSLFVRESPAASGRQSVQANVVFDVSTLTTAVSSARLEFTGYRRNAVAEAIFVSRFDDSDFRYIGFPGLFGLEMSVDISALADLTSGEFSVDVTEIVNSWIAGTANNGFAFRINEDTADSGFGIADDENDGTAIRLVIANDDSDGDGIDDTYEEAEGLIIGTNDSALDQDGDGLTNLQEFLGQDANGVVTPFGQTRAGSRDSDSDDIDDDVELSGSSNPYDDAGILVVAPATGAPTNPNSEDTDGDLAFDFVEINDEGSDPNVADTDGDGFDDGFEITNGLSPIIATGVDGPDGDLDGDNRTNLQEFERGTFINDADTDDDELNDGEEETAQSDPFVFDTDGDGLGDGAEVKGTPATSPIFADSDGDGFSDRLEAEAGLTAADSTLQPAFPTITWEAEEITAIEQLSTDGSLLFAENYNGATTVVNGISFEGIIDNSNPRSSENLLSLYSGALNATALYTGLARDFEPLFRTIWFQGGPSANVVGVSGLTPGATYEIQYGVSDDRNIDGVIDRFAFVDDFGGNTEDAPVGAENTIFGGSSNPAILFTGTFEAEFTVQAFSAGHFFETGSSSGSQIAFIQVRELALPLIPVEDIRVLAGSVEIDFSGLDTTRSYQLVQSLTLEDDFTEVVAGPRLAAGVTDTFTVTLDSDAPEKAFYRLVQLP